MKKAWVVLGAVLALVLFTGAAAHEAHMQQSPTKGSLEETPDGRTLISGWLESGDGGPLQGILLIEQGDLYNRNYRFGGLVNEKGHFSVEVDQGGAYGLHFYATGYIYLPPPVEVRPDRDDRYEFSLPPNPAVNDAPVIRRVDFQPNGEETVIRLEVFDPNGNLSHQVLALNAVSGKGFILKPEEFVASLEQKNFPNGIYFLRQEGRLDPRNWYFVAADTKCYNSPVMKFPFGQDDFVPAKPSDKIIQSDLAESREELVVVGSKVFKSNCIMCHGADTTETKVGPGLQGLFLREKLPTSGRPVSEAAVRDQIQQGGGQMPPYGHIRGRDLEALLAYLKTL